MATTYTLPTIEGLVGTFTITIVSDTAGLTTPTEQTVLRIGKLEERLNLEPGVSTLSTLEIEVFDDYSTHDYGFWYKVLQSEPTIKVILNENGSDTLYFFGTPQLETVQWTEHYVSDTAWRRSGVFELVSPNHLAFEDLGAGAIFGAGGLITQKVAGNSADVEPSYVVRLDYFWADILGTLNGGANLSDVSYVFDSSLPSIKWKGSDLNFYTPTQLYVCTNWTDSGGGFTDQVVDYFRSGSANYGSEYFDSAQDIARSLLHTFGMAMRLYYDISDDRYKIQLIQLRNAYSTTVTMGDFTESSARTATDMIVDSVRTRAIVTTAHKGWISTKYSTGIMVESNTYNEDDRISFDISRDIPWGEAGMSGNDPVNKTQFWASATGAADSFVEITSLEYRNYNTDAYDTVQYGAAGSPAPTYVVTNAASSVLYSQFAYPSRMYTRRYSDFGATSGGVLSHTNLVLGCRTTIDDGDASATYFANRIAKFAETGEVEVDWIEE